MGIFAVCPQKILKSVDWKNLILIRLRYPPYGDDDSVFEFQDINAFEEAGCRENGKKVSFHSSMLPPIEPRLDHLH